MSAFLSMWVGHTEQSRAFAQDVIEAIDAHYVKRETAAVEMGLTGPQLSRQLAGADPLNLWRLAALSNEFWFTFMALRTKRLGAELLTPAQVALLRGAAAVGKKRMAAMFAPVSRERQMS